MIAVDFSKLQKSGNEPGWYNGVCPSCGKRKFYINIYTGQYICFRESCHIRGSIKEKDGEILLPEETDSDLMQRAKALFTHQTFSGINLEQFSIPLTKKTSPFGYVYIRERGFTDSDIEKYHIRVGIDFVDDKGEYCTQWSQRVVFPCYENNLPIYAIGRTFNNRIPKYVNTKLSKSVILYNHENIKDKVIICEGLLSAIAAERYSGVPAVPLLGTYISDYQAFLVSKAEDIFISLDGGVDISKVHKKLEHYSSNIWYVKMPNGKDPDELKELYTICFKHAKRLKKIFIKQRNYTV